MNHITKISIVVVSILFLLSSCSLCSLIHEESWKEDVRVYQFNANGEMLLVGTVIHYYFFKNGENHGYDLADRGYSNSESLARKNIVNFLGDDPRLSEAVESKSIDPFDFDAICDMYKPKVFGDNVLEQ